MHRLVVGLLAALVFLPAASGAASPPLNTLLARHVPIFVLHPAETFSPVRVDGFLADSDLQGTGLNQRLCRAIEGPAASPCYAAAEEVHGSNPVVYGKAFRTKTRIDLQYWVWYPFNDYNATLPPGEVWQVHEGDWESVSVILDLRGRPLVLALSAHCKGSRRDWATAPKRGTRPLVHVALGSHAGYFGRGLHPHSPDCWPRETRDIVRALALADRTGAGTTVRPTLVPVTEARPSWMRFAGSWGETGYLHFANNPPVAYGTGPRGPAFHAQWRRPVTVAMSWPQK